jgi:microcystin-dependent protein
MATPFIAEIRMFGGNFAPRGNAFCNGQILAIAQNTALFSLLGTTYGGNGQTNFALPNLQSRAPMHPGQGPGLTARFLGEEGGSESVALIATEMPAHTHQASGVATAGGQASPANATWATVASGRNPLPLYAPTPNTTLNPLALSVAGGSQPHENMPPFLAITFIIALQGVFPPRN